MEKVSDGIWFIPGQDEFIPDSHTYVLGEPSTQDLSLIDPGLTGKAFYKIEAIQKMDVELEAIKRVILTHTHLDHIGCLPEILEHLPWAELWAHEAEATPLEQGDERTVYGMEMFRSMCEMQYGLKPGHFARTVDRHLEGDEVLDIGGTRWQVIHIPGHSMGGIALYDDSRKTLIPGDVVYADYAIGRFDLHGADPSELNGSLMRLAELEVEILLPGHNRIVKGLAPGYIRETAKQWEPYLV